MMLGYLGHQSADVNDVTCMYAHWKTKKGVDTLVLQIWQLITRCLILRAKSAIPDGEVNCM